MQLSRKSTFLLFLFIINVIPIDAYKLTNDNTEFDNDNSVDFPNFGVVTSYVVFDTLGVVTIMGCANAEENDFPLGIAGCAAYSVFLMNSLGMALGAWLENDNIERPSLLKTYAVGSLAGSATMSLEIPNILFRDNYEPGLFIVLAGFVGAIANHIYYGANRKMKTSDSSSSSPNYRYHFSSSF